VSPIRSEERSRYPEDWARISREVRADAGNRCEFCGVRNGARHPETGSRVVLTVAHLDHAPENCERANLRALCQLCHNRYDAKHRAAGRRARRRVAEEDAGQSRLGLPDR